MARSRPRPHPPDLELLHGDHDPPMPTPAEQAGSRDGRAVAREARREGGHGCAASRPESFVLQTLARAIEVIDMIPEGAPGTPWQDVDLRRKPVASPSETCLRVVEALSR